jgi:hypothetical protein
MPPERQTLDEVKAENRELYDQLAETGEMGRSCDAGGAIYEAWGWAGLDRLAEPIFESAEILMKDHPYVANRLLKGFIQ